MSNIIAIIWDCDKTLIDGYMQDPIFEEYNIDGGKFWKDNSAEIEKSRKKDIRVNEDTFYLNSFIRGAHNGQFANLSNAKLREFGDRQRFYPGIPELFKKTKDLLNDKSYNEYGI